MNEKSKNNTLTNLDKGINENKSSLKNAYFAGGCFWCMEGIFEAQEGVSEAISGYIGGNKDSAKYDQVSLGKTKHREGVKIIYDPKVINYSKLVELFWTQIDPTDPDGQFADKGYHYTTAMYYSNEDERSILEKSKTNLEESGKFEKPIVTKILPSTDFFEAEEDHQDYYKKFSSRYNIYKEGSGRKGFIDDNWEDRIKEIESGNIKKVNDIINETDEELRVRLTPLQYEVTQEGGTERAFNNKYWDNYEEGIYVDIVSGEALFSSNDKYNSGTGWPSFTKPIQAGVIEEKEDHKLFFKRTEVRTNSSHLGHVFEDGPKNKGGLRYCINSSSLKFIPKDQLKGSEYEKYLSLFE